MPQAARQRYSYYDDAYESSYARSSRYASSAVPSRQRQEQAQPDVRVIYGTRSDNPAFQGVSLRAARGFRTVLVVALVMLVLCACRVWLSAGTVASLDNINTLQTNLASAQASANELEIQHSILSSSSRIEEQAANMGMVAPTSVTYIEVTYPGGIALNSDGSISLASTIQNIEETLSTQVQ